MTEAATSPDSDDLLLLRIVGRILLPNQSEPANGHSRPCQAASVRVLGASRGRQPQKIKCIVIGRGIMQVADSTVSVHYYPVGQRTCHCLGKACCEVVVLSWRFEALMSCTLVVTPTRHGCICAYARCRDLGIFFLLPVSHILRTRDYVALKIIFSLI